MNLPFGQETVTIYNRRETKDANKRTVVTWHRRVLGGCFWTRKVETSRDGTAAILSDITVCKIPQRDDYKSPSEWDALVSVTNYFTLAPGDIIVLGSSTDEIGPTYSASDLIEEYRRSGVMTVKRAKNNVRPGIPLGHYRAEGG